MAEKLDLYTELMTYDKCVAMSHTHAQRARARVL